MFTSFENKVVQILKNTLPAELVPADRIRSGPIDEPSDLPTVAFTAGDFDIVPDKQMLDIPKASQDLSFTVSSRLEVWAENLEQVEEIGLKAMAVILINSRTIEDQSKGQMTMGNLKLSFTNSRFQPIKGIKKVSNGSNPKGEVNYTFESAMTVTRLDFSYGKMEVIEAFFETPLQSKVWINARSPILKRSVKDIKGVGGVTGDSLIAENIATIHDLAMARPSDLKEEIANIENLIQKAKDIRRITNEILREILDREHPFAENFFTVLLTDILTTPTTDIQNQTGKTAEDVAIFLDNLNDLRTDLINAPAFDTLKLSSFI